MCMWWSVVNIECQPQLRQGLSLNLKFTYLVRLGGQQVPGGVSLPVQLWVPLHVDFYVHAGHQTAVLVLNA